MIYTELSLLIEREMGHRPTSDQSAAIDGLAQFCAMPSSHKLFILRGYAGTGKTTVVSALIRAMRVRRVPTVLLAPTGRAAKVLSSYAQAPASSIHRAIYRQQAAGSGEFHLNYNSHKDTLFIVDEASMIANASTDGLQFGSGRLLDDLVEFVYSADNCSMVLIGDTAQLLPIGQTSSPALDTDVMRGYGLDVFEHRLTQVVRQSQESGILYNATLIRQSIAADEFKPTRLLPSFADMRRISGTELIEQLETSYNTVGEENTIILTYSNKRAVLFNRGVRSSVLFREDEISNGDFLMVTRNNYFWSAPYENLDFIANGDIAEVVRVGRHTELYNARFVDLTLRLIDYDMEITARVLLDSLYTETQQDVVGLNNRLTAAVAEDYADITDKRQFWREMQKNEYFNALQVKFAYAITGHKAQGGGWQHVYIDQGYLTEEMVSRQYYQWLYTAITRAQEQLYMVNFSDWFFDK